MAFKLTTANRAAVKVKGTRPDEEGRRTAFDFTLHCKRLKQDEIDALMDQKDKSIREFLKEVATGWAGVNDADNQPMPFNEETFDAVLNEIGVAGVCFQAYFKEVGATVKNS